MKLYTIAVLFIVFSVIGCNSNGDNSNEILTSFKNHKVEYIQDTLPNGVLAPKLAIIPRGVNRLGTDDESRPINERPSYLVDIKEPFALGVYEVTFEEYDLFCKETGRPKPTDEGWGRGKRPAIDSTWDDARAYVAWLSQQTGQDYFLPSEAQWEYAARAGTTTKYWWGDDPGDKNAQCGSCAQIHRCIDCKDVPLLDDGTAEVGFYKANAFGLYDVHGNLEEWTADCEIKSNPNITSNGKPRLNGDCERHIIKDGSWMNNVNFIQPSVRGGAVDGRDYSSKHVGIRVARKIK